MASDLQESMWQKVNKTKNKTIIFSRLYNNLSLPENIEEGEEYEGSISTLSFTSDNQFVALARISNNTWKIFGNGTYIINGYGSMGATNLTQVPSPFINTDGTYNMSYSKILEESSYRTETEFEQIATNIEKPFEAGTINEAWSYNSNIFRNNSKISNLGVIFGYNDMLQVDNQKNLMLATTERATHPTRFDYDFTSGMFPTVTDYSNALFGTRPQWLVFGKDYYDRLGGENEVKEYAKRRWNVDIPVGWYNIENNLVTFKDGNPYNGLNQSYGWVNAFNILVFNSEDYEQNEEDAQKFIDDPTPDNIPEDRAEVTDTNDDGTPDRDVIDKPNDEDDNTPDNTMDDTTFPDTYDKTTANFAYLINWNQLRQFTSYFWGGLSPSETIENLLSHVYDGVTKNVLSVIHIPISLSIPTATRSVKIGRLETDFTWNVVADNIIRYNVGEYTIKRHYNSFADYTPFTSMALYLPYYGILNLDTNAYMPKKGRSANTLKVVLIIDILTGDATYNILCNNTLLNQAPCTIGVPIPFTLDSAIEIQTQAVSNAASFASNVALAGATGGTSVMAMSMLGGMNNLSVSAPPLDLKGSVSGASGLGNPQKCALIIKRPRYVRPDNYGKTVGYPSNQTYKLSSCSGFTICKNAKIKSFPTGANLPNPTEDEYKKIIELLEEGVIL